MSRTLFATDLDGTLLNTSSVMTPSHAARLRRLIDDGMLFTVATGRHPTAALYALDGSGVPLTVPCACLNGAVLWDFSADRPADALTVAPEALARVWETVNRFDIPLRFCACDLAGGSLTTYYLPWLDREGSAPITRHLARETGNCHFAAASRERPPENVVSASYYFFREKLEPIREELRKIPGIRVVFYASTTMEGYYFLELYAGGGGKGWAVRRAMELCGADRLVSFGDSENDADMFTVSDASFAPANAAEDARRLATEVVASNDEGGVIDVMERLFTAERRDGAWRLA
jgi:Cof subfamily protein (haloacid dehalogenase superfamily)